MFGTITSPTATQSNLKRMIKSKSTLNRVLLIVSTAVLIFCNQTWAVIPAQPTPNEANVWDTAYDSKTKKRFIPVELFTGGTWNGNHELVMNPTSTTACSSFSGKPCNNYVITGPFNTEKNDTSIEWVGDQIPYYKRTFSTRRMGEVESFFTINNSKDGLVRIFDKRKQWGARTYSGLGSKFPLGYWKQGEIRHYSSRAPISIEILELDDPNHCLTFRWIIGTGKKPNSDNNYTFCPNRGFTKMSHNYKSEHSKK